VSFILGNNFCGWFIDKIMATTFTEWMSLRESTIWEKPGDLPSIFMSTYYALPTSKQLDEFQKYPDLSVDDIVQGFGYTIVGRGTSSPDNCQKIIEAIRMLAERYPERAVYKEALEKAKESARIKLEKWQRGVAFP
jgi:hypothetical protein